MPKEVSGIVWNAEAIIRNNPLLDPEEIRRLYWEERLSISTIAERFGVSTFPIRHTMCQSDIPRRSNAEAVALALKVSGHKSLMVGLEEIARLYWEEGLSCRTIAKRLRSTPGYIGKLMEKYDIPKRSRTEAQPKGSSCSYWKGGRFKQGKYITVKIYPDNPYYSMANSKGYVQEHRLVMAQHLGRCLEPWEIVHHRPPGDKTDNRYENLLLTSNENHFKEDRIIVLQLQEQVKDLQSRVTQLEAENVLLGKQQERKNNASYYPLEEFA